MTLTMEDFDHFLLVRNLPDTMVTPVPAAPPLSSPLQVSIPTPPTTPTMTQHVGHSTFMPNVKLDVKQYPTFNGDGSAWIKFKRGVLSIASTHGLDDVFDENKAPPVAGDADYPLFNDKNRFVYSIWMSRITAGMALSILREFEDARDGRGAYLKFLCVYEGKHNMRQMATMAMSKLNSLHMNYSSPGGIPTFITKFRDAVQDLKDAQNPITDEMAKSMLLSKIHDKSYSHIVDALLVSSDNYEECLQRLLDKHNMMNQNRDKNNNGQRNVNNANSNSRSKGRRNSNNHNNRSQNNNVGSQGNIDNGNKNNSQRPGRIPPHIWNTMSYDQKMEHLKKIGYYDKNRDPAYKHNNGQNPGPNSGNS